MRRRLKWALTVLTVLLAVCCGPWLFFWPFQNWGVYWGFGFLGLFRGTWPPGYPPYMLRFDLLWELGHGPQSLFSTQTYRSQFVNLTGTTVGLLPLFGLCLIGTIWWWIADRRRLVGHCSRCRYNLTGNTSGTCPECGHTISSGL